MAKSIEVNGNARKQLGTRANRRLREAGLLPGVIYGHKLDVLPITLPGKEVAHHINHGAHLFSLAIDGKNETVLVKEVQFDHLGIEVLHVDFARVDLNETVSLTVPLELKGTPKGVADGGILQQLLADLHVECLVTDIPDAIRHNISELALNGLLHIKELILPPNVKVLQDGDLIVATVKEIVEQAVTPAADAAVAEPEVIGRKAEEPAAEPAKK